MESVKVSIIIPVYNVENYIERCVRSLFKQTLDEIEFIFVDDCSPDNSMQIIENVLNDFPNRRYQVKIVRHKNNSGPSSARNSGVEVATGEYICYCDSDDWVDLDMYEKLYNEAKLTNSDICCCDFYMHQPNTVEYCKALDVVSDNKLQLLRAYMMSGWNSVVNMLVKRKLYIDYYIKGYEGFGFCEDYGLSVKLLYYASSVTRVPKAFYHYNRMNSNSIVATSLNIEKIEKITEDQIKIYSLINDFFKEQGLYDSLLDVLSYRMLCGKRGWLMNRKKHVEYRNLYPESNAYIWSNPLCSVKDKICQVIVMKPFLCFLLPIIQLLNTLAIKCKAKNK